MIQQTLYKERMMNKNTAMEQRLEKRFNGLVKKHALDEKEAAKVLSVISRLDDKYVATELSKPGAQEKIIQALKKSFKPIGDQALSSLKKILKDQATESEMKQLIDFFLSPGMNKDLATLTLNVAASLNDALDGAKIKLKEDTADVVFEELKLLAIESYKLVGEALVSIETKVGEDVVFAEMEAKALILVKARKPKDTPKDPKGDDKGNDPETTEDEVVGDVNLWGGGAMDGLEDVDESKKNTIKLGDKTVILVKDDKWTYDKSILELCGRVNDDDSHYVLSSFGPDKEHAFGKVYHNADGDIELYFGMFNTAESMDWGSKFDGESKEEVRLTIGDVLEPTCHNIRNKVVTSLYKENKLNLKEVNTLRDWLRDEMYLGDTEVE